MAEYTQLYSGLGWGTTFEMNAKKPLIAKRSFPTLNDAYGYVNDLTATGTACPGLIIAVTADTNDKNNGIYWIKSIGVAGADGELVPGELIKAGSGTGSMSIATLTVTDGKVTEATADNIGQIIYVTTGTDVYPAGPYIVTGDGTVAKLGTTTATGDIAGDVETLKGKVSTLETTVGNAESGLVKDVADIKKDYVAKVEGQRLMTDAEGTKLAGIADGAQVNVIESVKVDGTALDITDKSVDIILPVTGIATDDKVLSLDGKNVKSTLAFTRETIDGADSLVVKGNNGAVIGSVPVADFIADGMLESVAPKADDPNIFVFTFNSAAGSKSFEVDFSKYVDTYHADGVTIELGADNTFNVKAGVFDAAGAAADAEKNAKDYADEALKNYVKGADLDTTVFGLGYAKTVDVNKTLEGYVTSGALTTTLADYVKGADLDTTVSGLGYAKTADVNKTLEDYVTSDALADFDYVSHEDFNKTLDDFYYKSADVDQLLGAYAKTADVNAELLKKVDKTTLVDYVAKNDLDTEVAKLTYVKASVLNDYVTSTSLDTTLAGYVKTDDDAYVIAKDTIAHSNSLSVVETVNGEDSYKSLEVNAISVDDLKSLGILSE